MPRPAAFLDRDGTINVDTDHVSRPEDVRLIPGVAEVIRALNTEGTPVIVVTNQSGIGRGYFTEAQYASVRDRIGALLAAEGASVDAVFHCPHFPERDGPCDCRKPGLLNYQRATAQFDLDPSRSVFVGDRLTDALPAAAFGGYGVLVPSPRTKAEDIARAERDLAVAGTLGEAIAHWRRWRDG